MSPKRYYLWDRFLAVYPIYLMTFPHGVKDLIIHHYNVTDMRKMTNEQTEHLLRLMHMQMGVPL
jgi:hypothetical protein